MRALNRLSLRLRLTLAFAGAAAVLLTAIGTFVVLRVQAGLDGELDHALRLRAAELAESTRDLSRVSAIIDAAGQPAQVLDASGRVLASVRVPSGRPLVRRHLAEARRGEVIYESRERTRLLARPARGNRIVVVAASMRAREKTLETLRGVLLIGLPIAFNVFFFLLGRSFDYPGILRSPPGTVLSRLRLPWATCRAGRAASGVRLNVIVPPGIGRGRCGRPSSGRG